MTASERETRPGGQNTIGFPPAPPRGKRQEEGTPQGDGGSEAPKAIDWSRAATRQRPTSLTSGRPPPRKSAPKARRDLQRSGVLRGVEGCAAPAAGAASSTKKKNYCGECEFACSPGPDSDRGGGERGREEGDMRPYGPAE
ncbi:unnamed protein product [Prorocentrum cordatum]|uniref:Uncharacterized protein n=1 Tax=Prorocentrum cordatum TaxID=2364126 RepID=A0ABN9WV34_9DINO|nr:unnamed protein product [Polarella glacialis]